VPVILFRAGLASGVPRCKSLQCTANEKKSLNAVILDTTTYTEINILIMILRNDN
jgi:hypothetical protein